ncbi:MAG TPA: translation initiation factor IF-2 [Gammaproteobacteria bacterium]|nr:translation initiation factor IF-2 [Gammaproteobacteria bacterium]
MAEVTVKQFAEVVGIPVDRLLVQLEQAGSSITSPEQTISDKEKVELLSYLRRSHGAAEVSAVGEPQKITLKRRTVSELRQSGPQGKSKTVNVEVRKRRTYVKRSVAMADEAARIESQLAERERQEALERQQREEARRREEEARRQAEEAARQEEERRRKAAEEAKQRAEEEAARRRAEEEAASRARKAGEEGARRAAPAAPEKKEKRRPAKKEKEKEAADARATKYGRKELHLTAGKTGRRKGKQSRAKGGVAVGGGKHGFARPTAPIVREVSIPETITVAELAQKMSVKATEVIKFMMSLGTMATINQVLDQETATLVVEEMGHVAKPLQDVEMELEAADAGKAQGEALPRAPVVTIMGHVDHGKTSLLDYIRRSRVAAGEAGGITQHIGAYHVQTGRGMITFLDTPGHAAFTAMRARGAQVTDIVILVVAADDGVMPQTMEAIQHARAAGVPLVVAVNKIDKPDADPERVKQELVAQEVVPEEWGGDVMFVPVSAKTGQGVDDLLEALLLQAELMDLKAVKEAPAHGVVVESTLEKGRGPVATILVQSGTLRKGDVLLTGHEYGRVRAMFDENGHSVDEAPPSTPVQVLGLSGTPNAGDAAVVLADEKKAREIALFRQGKFRDVALARQQGAKLDEMFSQMGQGEVNTLNLVVKADVQGSLEALRESLIKLGTDEVQVKLVGSGVGGITESDVNLALTSQAVVVGFNVRADGSARRVAEERGVEVRYYSVIYDVIEDVRQALSGMLSPEIKEQIVGLAEVRDVFRSPKLGAIAGCLVVEGTVKRDNPIRVLRDNVVIYEGRLESLRRFKDDVNEVRAGTECGIGVKDYNDVKPGDQIEVYERVEVAREI